MVVAICFVIGFLIGVIVNADDLAEGLSKIRKILKEKEK